MVNTISNTTGGIHILGKPYNIFVYADDILLTSLTVTGLQKLIEVSNNYIIDHGLSFNPTKTKCITLGKCHLQSTPLLELNGSQLKMYDSIDYLGAILSNDHSLHFERRIKSCRQAFYGLQSAGLCDSGVKPYTAAHMWKVAVQPVLLYACQSVPTSKTCVKHMDMLQAKLIKASLGLSKYMRTTPMINAMNIQTISNMIVIQSINMFKAIINNSSGAKDFYNNLMKTSSHRQFNSYLRDIHHICRDNEISLVKFIVNDDYSIRAKKSLKCLPQPDGLTDSIRMLLSNYSNYDKELVKMLLSPF